MASRARQITALVTKQGNTIARRTYHASPLTKAGMAPPLPPFARIPVESGSINENTDVLWDDGVAPELALDFDAPNISSTEALYTWAGAFSVFVVLFNVIKAGTTENNDGNPALSHATDCVVPDYSDPVVMANLNK